MCMLPAHVTQTLASWVCKWPKNFLSFACLQSSASARSFAHAHKSHPPTSRQLFSVASLHPCNRHRGDSNPCGQSPMDFESISLAARTHVSSDLHSLTFTCTHALFPSHCMDALQQVQPGPKGPMTEEGKLGTCWEQV